MSDDRIHLDNRPSTDGFFYGTDHTRCQCWFDGCLFGKKCIRGNGFWIPADKYLLADPRNGIVADRYRWHLLYTIYFQDCYILAWHRPAFFDQACRHTANGL